MRNYNRQSVEQRQSIFIDQASKIHNGAYLYDKVKLVNTHTPVIITCPVHGDFLKRPVKHISAKEGCPECSKKAKVSSRCKFTNFDEIVEAASTVHQFEYQYHKVVSSNQYITTNDTLVINCPIHGAFEQTINKHIYQKTGCPQCFVDRNARKRTKTTEQFIKDSIQVHGDLYDYTDTVYYGAHKPVQIKCKQHGIFEITPANHILKQQGCNLCHTSGPELIIHQMLTENNINFVHQYSTDQCVSPFTGRPLKFDFFLPDHRIIIEYDGIYHYEAIDHGLGPQDASDRLNRQQYHDSVKDSYAELMGYKMIRIPYFDDINIRDRLDAILINVSDELRSDVDH